MSRKRKQNEPEVLGGMWINTNEKRKKWNNLHQKLLELLQTEFEEPIEGLIFLKWEVELFEKSLDLKGAVLEKQKISATTQ